MTADFESKNKFHVHHVGGRAGSIGFPDLPNFRDDVINVIYDADESCLAQIENIWKDKHVSVLPYCLFSKKGTASFHINYCPYTSSLYPVNPVYGNYYHKGQGSSDTDYAYFGALKTERVIEVETFTLDYLVERDIVPGCDFLSIDTQGAELPILEGAVKELRDSIVAVQVEINFAPLYEGAPLFGELDGFLRKKNFLLASIETIDLGYKRIGKGCRGKGIPLQGEALYLLSPDATTDAQRLKKLSFAALAFGYTELAFEAVERALSFDKSRCEGNRINYFLLEFRREVQKDTDIPPLWHEVFSFKESNQRFTVPNERGELKYYLYMLFKEPSKYFPVIINKIYSKLANRFSLSVQNICLALGLSLSSRPPKSPFEDFMLRSGFDLAVNRIRERRHRGC